MPIYEYACETCGEDFEVLQKMSEPPLKRHECSPKSSVKRKMSRTAFQLKGGGWYSEGYSSGGSSKSSSAGSSSSGAACGGGG